MRNRLEEISQIQRSFEKLLHFLCRKNTSIIYKKSTYNKKLIRSALPVIFIETYKNVGSLSKNDMYVGKCS